MAPLLACSALPGLYRAWGAVPADQPWARASKGNETLCPGKLNRPFSTKTTRRADFAAATKFPRGLRLKDLTRSELARRVGKRGLQKTPAKIPVSIRLSPEVVKHFKSKGPGRQSRIDAALRKIAKKAS